jgi:hypothetical protein
VADDTKAPQSNPSPEATLERIQGPVEGDTILPGSVRKVWLFTYDVLMNPAVLSRYVKGVVPGKVVNLPSFRLTWPFYYPPQETALPSLERQEGPTQGGVWGVIYDVTKKDLTGLERYLHAPHRYHQRALNVVDRGDFRYPAVGYVLSVSGGSPLAPSAAYRDELLTVARDRTLPEEWLGYLEELKVGG